MIEVTLNGAKQQAPENITLLEYLAILRLKGKRIAVAINGEIVGTMALSETRLSQGDVVEIVHPVGGGQY